MIAAVFDTTVLSNFAHIHQPHLLRLAFDTPVTVKAVVTEWTAGIGSGRIRDVNWTWLPTIELTPQELTKAENLCLTLGRGEAQCLALAEGRG